LWRTHDAFWVNHPDRNRLAGSKLHQLRHAREIGFRVPATLVSNNADELREFAARHAVTGIVCKPLGEGRLDLSEGERLFFTSRFDLTKEDDLSDLGPEPYLFQEFVAKRYDLRVTVIGDAVFAVRIESQQSAVSEVDWRRAGGAQPHEIEELLRTMRARRPRPYAEATIANVLNVIRALYRLAHSRGYASRSPVTGLDPAELPRPRSANLGRVLEETELAALIRHTRPVYRNVVTVLAYTGLRLSEALGLRWCDIDLVEGELHVRGQLQLGSGDRPTRWVSLLKSAASSRTVPLFPAVEAALVDQLASEQAAGRGSDTDLVFCSRRGRPLTHRNVAQRGVEEAASKAGFGKVTPHDLRRSFCSLAGRRGVDPIEAAQITGHSPAVWARFYARSFGKAQRDEARDRLLKHGFGALSEDGSPGPLAPAPPEQPLQMVDVRDLADWIVRMVEERQGGVFNATSPPGALTFGSMLDGCGAEEVVWVDEDFLLEQAVEGWSDLPCWIPSNMPDHACFQLVEVSRALAAGLTFRPLEETARDVPEWAGEAGLAPEREAELLEAWKAVV
jgi:integrase